MHLQARHVAKFHADIDRVCNHRNIAAVTETACDPRGRGTRGKTNCLVFVNELGGGDANVSLLFHGTLLTALKRSVKAEGLVKKLLHQSGTAVGSSCQPLAFQPSQVPPDARGRSTQGMDQFFYGYAALLQQQFKNAISAMFAS